MNISLLSFKPSSRSLGLLRDVLSGNSIGMVGEERRQNIASSVGRQMKLELEPMTDQQSNFIIQIKGEFKHDYDLCMYMYMYIHVHVDAYTCTCTYEAAYIVYSNVRLCNI